MFHINFITSCHLSHYFVNINFCDIANLLFAHVWKVSLSTGNIASLQSLGGVAAVDIIQVDITAIDDRW